MTPSPSGSSPGRDDLAPTHQPVIAGQPAIGFGTVWHRRNQPATHQFSYRVNQLWLDPDEPQAIFDNHRLWSVDKRRPIRFRAEDYFDGSGGSVGPGIRSLLAPVFGHQPEGPIRMLSQPRTWGWMFNPITVYLAWDAEGAFDPVGAVLEVTNTPWKERVMYPLRLERAGERLTARFTKQLHVSPFLDENYDYVLSVAQQPLPTRTPTEPGRSLQIGIDVHRPRSNETDRVDDPVVETALDINLHQPTPRTMTRALYRNPVPTHRVSLGIHWQAARLAAKRVPFISHPRKRP